MPRRDKDKYTSQRERKADHIAESREEHGTTRGGHLQEAIVRPTREVTIIASPAHLRRKKHPDLGIALIEF